MAEKEEDIIKKLNVSIFSPKENLFDGEADIIIAPGRNGILGILPDHTKMVSLLKEGEILIKNKGAEPQSFSLKEGLIEVLRERVEILISA